MLSGDMCQRVINASRVCLDTIYITTSSTIVDISIGVLIEETIVSFTIVNEQRALQAQDLCIPNALLLHCLHPSPIANVMHYLSVN